ncbi:MAG TPA: APC family permease [Bryobacteraceae bacterium]|nr:APC family permease [Bryobacteraceae bacterium]
MAAPQSETEFRRVLRLRDLVLYGIIIVQPTAPMPIFGVVSQQARGHVVTAVLIAMAAMLFTAISYGRMARAYPSAGSAYSYVTHALHPALGYLAGWSIVLDYLLNPIICTIWCSKAAGNFFPMIPYPVFAIGFALLFTVLSLRGIETSARVNQAMAIAMGAVVFAFLAYAVRFILQQPDLSMVRFLRPFYDPKTFSFPAVSNGTAIAVLTYIGFDGITTLSEEVENPKRNVPIAIVMVCLITGALASLEVYAGQLIWPDYQHYPDVDTAFVHVAGRAGGVVLFNIVNFTLLMATIGSGFGAQLASARLLFGMGRDDALPRRFFGVLEPVRRIPRNNVLLCGAIALVGAMTMSYQLGAELLNFGAFVAFMGVNAAAFVHYCVRRGERSASYWLPPVAGFLVCFYMWISLSQPAKIVGAAWLCVGLLFGWINGKFKTTRNNHAS